MTDGDVALMVQAAMLAAWLGFRVWLISRHLERLEGQLQDLKTLVHLARKGK